MTDFEYIIKYCNAPTICPCCGSKLIIDSVNLVCPNKNCKDQIIYQITHFIKKLGIKNASNTTLDNFKIYTYNDLINFRPNQKYKSEVKFYNELTVKVFSRSKQEILSALNIKDVGETLINKIIDYYGFENILNDNYNKPLPEGIGEITLNKFRSSIKDNIKILDMFINDQRYHYTETSTQKVSREFIGSVCFTGNLNTMSRSQASKKATDAGYEVKSGVSKGLTYLITNDKNSGSSKNKKANALNIKIINEQEFIDLINSTQSSISDLDNL